MRICVLVDDYAEDIHPNPFLPGHDVDMHFLEVPVFDRLRVLVEGGSYDVFLNLCRGYELDEIEPGGPGYLGVEVVQALESLGVPFTGADARCFSPSPEEQRSAAEANGIRFVKGDRVENAKQAAELAAGLRYPIMVKSTRSRRGVGIPETERAETPDEVRAEAARMLINFGAARIEEYVAGDEYNVLVVDNADDLARPHLYPPAQLVFLPGQEFARADPTWISEMSFEFRRMEDASLAAALQAMAGRMYLAMGIAGYARVDIRTEGGEDPVIMGVITNPPLMSPGNEYGQADYMILFDKDGYRGFFTRAFAAAFARRDLRLGGRPTEAARVRTV